MKARNLNFLFVIAIAMTTTFFASCDDDDDSFDAPTVTLNPEILSAKVGETIEITATATTPGGFNKIVVTQMHDGVSVGSTEFTEESDTYVLSYNVVEEDVDPILSFNFTVTDNQNQNGSREAVVDVELTMSQILVKYDWLLTDEIRKKTETSDISDVYTDDVYRFHADGSYDKSIGAKVDAFSDIWFNYCYWSLDEDESMLIMTRTGAFLEDARDTLMITTLNATALEGDVIYRGLDAFNTGTEEVPYEAVEDYIKKFAAQAKGDSFDPYQAGEEDDAGPAGICNDIVWK